MTDREIKFRYIWQHRETGQFVTEILPIKTLELGDYAALYDYDWRRAYKRIARSQYTGVKGRNGVEIFEGDVLEMSATKRHQKRRQVVEFEQDAWNTRFARVSTDGLRYDLGTKTNQVLVIGNIHEHPELMEQ